MARQAEDVRLVDVLQQGEASGHVTVERRVTDRKLGLVSRRDEHPPELVGERHQEHSSYARLDVLLGEVRLATGECVCERLREGVDDRADRDLHEGTAEILRQPARIRTGRFGGVARRHRNAVDPLRPERFRGQCCGDGQYHADHFYPPCCRPGVGERTP